MAGRPDLLIERTFPVEAVGAEALRERTASSALPPLYFLHVWWARRPLIVSRAAVLASLLPAETDDHWFLEALGIPAAPPRPRFGYPRAFTTNPVGGRLDELRGRLASVWGPGPRTVLDPMAGGGSIPFEAWRSGFQTIAGELNPVAAVILRATLDLLARFGADLVGDLARWGTELARRAARDLEPYFPKALGERVWAYLWARTVACPGCHLVVPLARWDSTRRKIANTFDRHDFGFVWSYAEFDGADQLFPWALSQVVEAYQAIARLLTPAATNLPRLAQAVTRPPERLCLVASDAARLGAVADGSVDLVCVDPPYGDNVMYAELADFFYVWQRLTLGDVYPELFDGEFTPKADEAVANRARHRHGADPAPARLARASYAGKLTAIFDEMRRVLRPDGVLTLMFTHRSALTWEVIASALLAARFEITATWAVPTDSAASLHLVRTNACRNTVLLVCRQRVEAARGARWADVEPAVVAAASSLANTPGTRADAEVARFGPVLQVLSRDWPVLDADGREVSIGRVLRRVQAQAALPVFRP